jgi:hypothetical protein
MMVPNDIQLGMAMLMAAGRPIGWGAVVCRPARKRFGCAISLHRRRESFWTTRRIDAIYGATLSCTDLETTGW